VTLFPANSPPLCFQLKIQSSQTLLTDLKDQIIAISPIPVVWENLFLTQVKDGIIKCGHTKDQDVVPSLLSPAHYYFIYDVPRINTIVEDIIEKDKDNKDPIKVSRSHSVGVEKNSKPNYSERRLSKVPHIPVHIATDRIRQLNPSFTSITPSVRAIVRHQNYLNTFIPYGDVLCQFVCRRFTARNSKGPVNINFYGYPLLLRFSRYISHKELILAVKGRLSAYTRPYNSEEKSRDIFGAHCSSKEFESSLVSEISPISNLEKELECSFSLRYVNQGGTRCGLCDSSSGCRGCPLEDISVRSLENGKLIAIDFHTHVEFIPVELSKATEETEQIVSEVEQSEKPDTSEFRKQMSSSDVKDHLLALRHCVKAFLRTENLATSLYCKNCSEENTATKQFNLWKFPNILVIHLKRFKHEQFSSVS